MQLTQLIASERSKATAACPDAATTAPAASPVVTLSSIDTAERTVAFAAVRTTAPEPSGSHSSPGSEEPSAVAVVAATAQLEAVASVDAPAAAAKQRISAGSADVLLLKGSLLNAAALPQLAQWDTVVSIEARENGDSESDTPVLHAVSL